jgi:hypothetical protein
MLSEWVGGYSGIRSEPFWVADAGLVRIVVHWLGQIVVGRSFVIFACIGVRCFGTDQSRRVYSSIESLCIQMKRVLGSAHQSALAGCDVPIKLISFS